MRWLRGIESAKLERGSLAGGHGRIIVRALIAIGLLAIAAGILVPSLQHKQKREALTAFDEVGPGEIEGNLCTNDFFGFSIAPPRNWHYASREVLKRHLEREKESDRQNVALIFLSFRFRKATRDLGTFNPSLFVFAERLSNMPGVSSSEEYLLGCFRQTKERNPDCGTPTRPYKYPIGDQTFWRLDVRGRLQGRIANTSHLAALRGSYAFSIAVAWENDEDGRVLAPRR